MSDAASQRDGRSPAMRCCTREAAAALAVCSCATWNSSQASASSSTRFDTSSASSYPRISPWPDDYDGKSDRLADVLDYGKVVDGISRLVQSEHVNLIETLAERIAASCLADRRVESVRVRIEKPDILPSCKSVGIEIERHQQGR